jgi:2-oxoglutarate dehydrogenase E2 component (dihydrolipoamide succinyltransferase)
MAVDIRIPQLGESVSEGVIVQWLKKDGDVVKADEPVLELETEKAAMEINAEAAGRLQIIEPVGARVAVGAVVGRIDTAAAAPAPAKERGKAAATAPATSPAPAPPTPAKTAGTAAPPKEAAAPATPPPLETVEWRPPAAATAAPADGRREAATAKPAKKPAASTTGEDVERVPMSQLRQTIAARLVEAQRTAAILTTFNEVDLGTLMDLRARYRERFKKKYDVDLGLMSLFARASVMALREIRIVNARIEGTDIVYQRRVHLGIAVSTPRGLVVPVIRDADAMSLAELERAIGERAKKARDGKLAPDDLAGGTFTITNGGVFGSLLSTPILNPPQAAILGMHKIQPRPVAVDGQVVIRPMMYVALSYDHRLIDGEQAVTFLVHVKNLLEDPARMVLEV